MNLGRDPGNDKKLRTLYLPSKLDKCLCSLTMVKEKSKLFSCDYGHYTLWWNVAKMKRYIDLYEEINTEPLTGKNDRFWLLWETFKEYIKQNVIMAVLRKTNFHSVDICRFIKQPIM